MANKRLTKEQNAQFDKEHGDEWFELPTPAGALAFKKPSQPDYERFVEKVGKKDTKGDMAACREICLCCRIAPDSIEAAEAIFAAYPHAPQVAAQGIQALAGGDLEIVKKG